jgi:hypothetical protein
MGEHLELMRPPAPSQLHLHGAVSLTEICEEASLPEAMDGVGRLSVLHIIFGHVFRHRANVFGVSGTGFKRLR